MTDENKHQNKNFLYNDAMSMTQDTNEHIPVLLEPVLEYLAPRSGESYLDLTAGYGGHASAVLMRTDAPERMTLVDRDQAAIRTLETFKSRGATLLKTDFLSASQKLTTEGERFDMVLADLGVSSPHLDNADRGFAFNRDGPLDMRMDQTAGRTAAQIVNDEREDTLIDIIRRYGEEPQAGRVARAIIANRPITTTKQLANVIWQALPSQRGNRTHPATKTFQGLRIAVNDELDLLEQALPLWLDLLAPGGRLCVISFHSLEDRIVKRVFKEYAGDRYDASATMLTKRPVVASHTELVSNPRARSAKLRAVAK